MLGATAAVNMLRSGAVEEPHDSWRGRSVLVTGGAVRIGRAIARAFAEAGADEAREAAEHRVAQLERRLAQAPQPVALPQPSGDADLPSEEEASTFLVPVLTREFYDSIERWDRRMQRAAFDKIHRLANDWRHGSLRALALEGVPGYYRIRVATDVRLIYRRDGNRLEVLSLIDREDLDRYVRQARTRTVEQRGKSEAPDAR